MSLMRFWFRKAAFGRASEIELKAFPRRFRYRWVVGPIGRAQSRTEGRVTERAN